MTDTASPVEILFFAIGLLCLLVSVINLQTSMRVLKAVRARSQSGSYLDRLAVARRDRRNDIIRCVKQILWSSVWAGSLFIPAPVRSSVEAFTIYAGIVLLTNQILLTYASIADRRDRLALLKRRRRPTIPLKETPDGPKQQ